MDNQKPKSFLDDLVEEKPESFKEEVFTRQKKNYIPTIIITSIILIIATFLYITFTKGSTVVDMSDWSEQEVYAWSSTNNAKIIKEEAYSLDQETGHVLSQNLPAGSKLKRNASITVTFSIGPDPNESISLPDLKTMTLDEINKWISDNQLTGISIKEENNSVFPKDSVINIEFVDGNQDNFIRKNRIKVYVSLGSQELTDTISIPDLLGQDKGSIAKWAKKNKVDIVFEEAFDEYVEYGKASAQSIEANTKMKRDDTLTLTMSLGKKILVPDFTSSTREEASELATNRGFQVLFKNQLSAKEQGTILSQDIDAGTIINKEQVVTITVASTSDQIQVPNLIGLSQNEASTLAGIYNLKTFFVTKESNEKENTVIGQSIDPDRYITNDTLVTIYVSSGDVLVPEFIGMTKEDAEILGADLGLKITFRNVPDKSVSNDTILSQSTEKELSISKDTNIILSVASNNSAIVPDFSTMSRIEVDRWASLNDTTLTVIENYNSKKPIGSMYNQNIINNYVASDEKLFVYQSLGDVPVIDFTDKTKLDVLTWQKEVNSNGGGISINFNDAKNTTKEEGLIVDQSVRLDTIKVNSVIDVWIAVGSLANQIPDMTHIDEDVFISWCNTNSISFKIIDQYSDNERVGELFGQNYKDQYMPAGETLRIYRSIGRVEIDNFTNHSLDELEKWKNLANMNGADIKLTFFYSSEITSTYETVLVQSIINTSIPVGTTIQVTLPTPTGSIVPNLIGKHYTTAVKLLAGRGIPYEINYTEYENKKGENYPDNIVIGQSEEAGTKIEDDMVITISVIKNN